MKSKRSKSKSSQPEQTIAETKIDLGNSAVQLTDNKNDEVDTSSPLNQITEVVKIQEEKPSKLNIILANCISVFHALVVLFVLFAPWCNIPYFLILHATFCISLLVHWYFNSNVCSLSVMESQLRGLNYTESFTHKFIGPVYEVTQTSWAAVCWTLTICLFLVSVYKIYYCEKWTIVFEHYNKIIENTPETTIQDRMKAWACCIQILFT